MLYPVSLTNMLEGPCLCHAEPSQPRRHAANEAEGAACTRGADASEGGVRREGAVRMDAGIGEAGSP